MDLIIATWHDLQSAVIDFLGMSLKEQFITICIIIVAVGFFREKVLNR
ncbi:hypothetical protein [Hydrogenimonas thermophila]|uniref:Uncharacterized protein n=1 Tax=Hydrogenimonas thermophila TaxID=223786 RepID=A0A1I5UNX8_9BACT|nr:hypothetical protein [Hydrogenimonas thermophila]SFP96316.1 hypothetical protein SAMN05216234_16510 [Hydrogenimonas thermophila]